MMKKHIMEYLSYDFFFLLFFFFLHNYMDCAALFIFYTFDGQHEDQSV